MAEYADGRLDPVGLTGPILVEAMGRSTVDEALVLGNTVPIGHTILETLGLLANGRNRRLFPNPDHPNQSARKVK